jgi:hypothetical protein
MKQRAEQSKLAELRARTDRQILTLVSHRLEAAIGAAEQSGDFSNTAEVYEEASRWLSLVRSAPPNQLRHVESQLGRLLKFVPRKWHACCA